MATEKRLIDANVLDEILKDFESRYKDHCFVLSAKAIAFTRQIVYATKTVDAVEVVRCKDCKHRHTRANCQGRRMDFFCGDGERKYNGKA